MGIKPDTVRHLINRTLGHGGDPRRRGDAGAGERPAGPDSGSHLVQRAGRDYRAVMVFLQMSQRRAKLNGLDSPASIRDLTPCADGDGAGFVPPLTGDGHGRR